ncbi:MAG: aminodeoxychorismate/anthranilate synthase component II [Pseudomonadota bacterium]
MLLLIDNYDSFTWNLYHYLGQELQRADFEADDGSNGPPQEIRVERNDALTAKEAMALRPDAVVLSPGPCDPDKAGVCLDLIDALDDETPLLGVCLGHQAIGQAFGGKVVRAAEVMHGKTSPIHHGGDSVFRGLPDPFTATRYHSLIVERDSLPESLEVTAETEDGVIMGLRHATRPIHGVQFHPESIATDHGHRLLRNFLELAKLI